MWLFSLPPKLSFVICFLYFGYNIFSEGAIDLSYHKGVGNLEVHGYPLMFSFFWLSEYYSKNNKWDHFAQRSIKSLPDTYISFKGYTYICIFANYHFWYLLQVFIRSIQRANAVQWEAMTGLLALQFSWYFLIEVLFPYFLIYFLKQYFWTFEKYLVTLKTHSLQHLLYHQTQVRFFLNMAWFHSLLSINSCLINAHS